MLSLRYPLHIAVLACFLAKGYGGGYVLIPKTTRVIEDSTLRLDCIYKSNTAVIPETCRWNTIENGLNVPIALIYDKCTVANFFPDIYTFECENATYNTMSIISTGRIFHNKIFNCSFFVDNILTAGNSTVHVIVPVSSIKLTEPTTDFVITTDNSTVKFICNASGAHPRPNITWYSDSRTPFDYIDDVAIIKNIIMRSDDDGYLYTVMTILTFYPTKYDNGSSIYCNASNTEQHSISSTRKALLYVQYPPSKPLFFMRSNVSLKEVAIIINNALTIRCKSSGNPFPSYKWTTPQNKEVSGEDLNIENIKQTDDGTYSCMAYNAFTTAGEKGNYNNSASFEVTVLFPPDSPKLYYISRGMTKQIGNSTINVVSGDDVRVLCNSTGKPHPVSVWNRPEANDVLSIKSIRADVNNTCTSLNRMTETAGETQIGSESRELTLIVSYPPKTPTITIHLSENKVEAVGVVDVIENSNILLECLAESKPNSTLIWSRSMNEIIKDISKQMIVKHIQRNQSGTYTCHAKNVMIRSFGANEIGRNNQSIYFDVLYPPDTPTFYHLENGNKQKINTLPLKVVEGDSVNVLCNATGNPTPTSVWMDNDAKTDTLSRVSVEIKHQTNITCKSSNVMHPTFGISGNGTSSKNLQLIVLYPPRNPVIQIETKADSRQEALNFTGITEGSDLSLYCEAVSNPSPSYKWTGPVSSNHMGNSAELFLGNIQRNQSGPYICDAQNKMERSFGNMETGWNKRSIYFDILYKADIKYFGAANIKNSMNMMTISQSEETQIICKLDSNPFSNNTIFFKGRLVNETIRSDTVTYNLINSNCSDAGRFICKGKNEYNFGADASKELVLYVKCLPQPSDSQPPEKNVSAALSDSALFRFHAAPYYDPGITEFRWFKQQNHSRILLRNGTKTYISSSDIHSVLRITDVAEADYGMYIIEYNNSVGINSFTFYLQQGYHTEEIHQGNDKNYIPVVIGIFIAALVIVGITLGLVIYMKRYKQKSVRNKRNSDRSYDNICGMNINSGGNSINCETVYEGLKPIDEREYMEMKEQAYDILKPKDCPDTKDPVYTNLKL